MLEKLVGMMGDENTLFETIVFEVESDYDFYHTNHFVIPLKVLENNQFQIESVLWQKDYPEDARPDADFLKKRFWFSNVGKSKRIDMFFHRTDMSVKCAEIFRDRDWELWLGYAMDPDEPPPRELTPEEIRRGFQELCGILQDDIEIKSKPKKAM